MKIAVSDLLRVVVCRGYRRSTCVSAHPQLVGVHSPAADGGQPSVMRSVCAVVPASLSEVFTWCT